MTASANIRGGRQATWTRDKIIERIRRWNALYGSPPCSADWNPSAAKWSASEWRKPRYLQGDPETGEAWPSLNAAKKLFGGSLSAAIEAAGLEPNKPGPKARKDVDVDIDRASPGELRVLVGKAEAEARELRKSVEVRERQLARARDATKAATDALEAARAVSRKVRVETRTKTKTVTKIKADSSLKARAARLAEQLKAAKFEVKELKSAERAARMDAARAAARLERSEATVRDLRADMRALKRDLERSEDTSSRLKGAAVRSGSKPKPEVREKVRVERVVVHEPAPAQVVVDAALAESKSARERAELAEARYLELARAVTGEMRRLTPKEMSELRKRGPSGPAVMARALESLAEARKEGGVQPLKAALHELAAAALTWKDSA